VRLLADHCVYERTLRALERSGHEVVRARTRGLDRVADDALAAAAVADGIPLITADLGFASILQYPPDRYPGFVVLRATARTIERVEQLLLAHLSGLETAELAGSLVVIAAGGVRSWRSPTS
jgi:predicted nuclease of predicted toxin-antitoxin system